jgi:phage-related protein
VREFIDSLPVQDRARIFYDLNRLAEYGLQNCGLSLRQIDRKLWEIRIKLSVGYRIFYCVVSPYIWLLHAYKKQSQKAPDKEIKIAKQRMKEIL